MSALWSGQWVADRLPACLVCAPGAEGSGEDGGLGVRDLVGMALRINPRRSHLLVSRVLGKHVPTDPRIVYGAGRLLGAKVADALSGVDSGIGSRGGCLLAAALDGVTAAASELLASCDQHRHTRSLPAPGAVVLGYAETATALGHSVADALGAPYLHSTRRPVPTVRSVGVFHEEHSHATRHLLLPELRDFLAGPGPLVLVDDELSTGQTVLNTIRLLHASLPRSRYVIATLVDLRSPADRARLAATAAELGDVRIEVVCLAAGQLELAPDALTAGQRIVAGILTETPAQAAPVPTPVVAGIGHVDHRWPAGVRDGGRHGFTEQHRADFEAAVAGTAAILASASASASASADTDADAGSPPAGSAGRRVLVLGTEELMYAPLRIAVALADELAGAAVYFSTTTRSPVLAVDEPGYAIRSRLTFPAHDDPADGPGMRYAYNVAPARGTAPFDEVIVVDDVGTGELTGTDGLLARLATVTASVRLLVIPSYRPLPVPLRGPAFGSYAPDEVAWLLTDLSAVTLEAPTEEREEAIQSGGAHYAESLPIEYQPGEEYQRLFQAALEESAGTVARAVGVATELVLAERGTDTVLVSLARAGTPVGILMRRWARFAHGLDLPHYAVSIVRGRGIDTVALRYLATHHDPAAVQFVDGWTGKGAIAGELEAAVLAANAELRCSDTDRRFSAELAVLADPGRCVRLFGTRDDFLIPSACLNSTVSGLVSRTVLNGTVLRPGQFHGAKYYRELAGSDVSARFLDAVSARFGVVLSGVASELAVQRDSDRTPTWAGRASVERISAEFGIGDVNLVKPGVGETTRVLLRRVPWKVLMRSDAAGLAHVRLLAGERGVPIEIVDDMPYSCVGLIQPNFTRAGADSR